MMLLTTAKRVRAGRGGGLASLLGLACAGVAAALLAGCGESSTGAATPATGNGGTPAPGGGGAGKDRYVIGVIPKSQSNPVYIAARAGAEQAQREIAAQHGIEIELRWQAPFEEDASRQVQFIRELATIDADGIAISCSDPVTASLAINEAVIAGTQVVTFDSDAPDSNRFAHVGIDDRAAGALVMERLIDAVGSEGGRIAILAGNPTAENMRSRVLGARDEAIKHENIQLIGVFRHDETPAAAAAAMAEAHADYEPIAGWALMGGWPLYESSGLDGVPDGVPIVSMDPLPPALDFAESGRVQALVAQPYFEWGHTSVRLLFERLHEGKLPESPQINADLEVIEGDGIDRYRTRWRGWVGHVDVVTTGG